MKVHLARLRETAEGLLISLPYKLSVCCSVRIPLIRQFNYIIIGETAIAADSKINQKETGRNHVGMGWHLGVARIKIRAPD
jgi:hypothetical protein